MLKKTPDHRYVDTLTNESIVFYSIAAGVVAVYSEVEQKLIETYFGKNHDDVSRYKKHLDDETFFSSVMEMFSIVVPKVDSIGKVYTILLLIHEYNISMSNANAVLDKINHNINKLNFN
jgi:hypothetical protein